jgi:hypothetical protein
MSAESERETRKRRIDPKLTAAGWRIVPFVPGQPIDMYGDSAGLLVISEATEAPPRHDDGVAPVTYRSGA